MADSALKTVLVILGPTGSGKSALALEVARRACGEILCVDSMTLYRGMDIGTAKPSRNEQAGIKHHLLDIVEPDSEFTVARFVEMADGVIASARARGVGVVATGGTPLYYKALLEGLFEGPSADSELRAKLSAKGNVALHEELSRVDAEAASRIHVNDTKRLVRALEVYHLTGKPISAQQNEWSTGRFRHPVTLVGLMWEKEQLNRRINVRVKAMMAAGWLEEVRGLLARYPQLSRTASEATGYAELIAHIEGKLSLEDAVERIKIAHRQLARKQMKWFRRFAGVKWLDGAADAGKLVEQTLSYWLADCSMAGERV